MKLEFKFLTLILLTFAFLGLVPKVIEADTCAPIFPATTCSVSESVTVTAVVPDTSVTFSGFAPAGSVVYIREGGFIVGTTLTPSSGLFSKTITSTPGVHTYLVYLTDNQGRTTPETVLDQITLIAQSDLPISNIHLPPTIALSKSSVSQDQTVFIFGQGAPGSTINLYVNGSKRFTALVGASSTWQFDLTASTLPPQTTFYAISTRTGLADSQKSQTVSLEVLACSDANCNRITQLPPSTATPSATAGPTYKFKLEIGENLRNFLLLTSIFISFFGLIIFFLLLFLRRRKDKRKVLEELERKVEQDLQTSDPVQNIRKDFDETEEKIS